MGDTTPRIKQEARQVLLPVAYLPPLEYMVCMVSAGRAVIELHETYQRQSWRNRCNIYTANGVRNLIIPVECPSGNRSQTNEVVVSTHENWRKKHWRSITSAYRNSPFFIYYQDLLAPFFLRPTSTPEFLWEFNLKVLQSIMGELSIPADISLTRSYEREPQGMIDLREKLTPKIHRREYPLISHWPFYQQTFTEKHGFIPNLSIADLMFNLGPASNDYLTETAKYLETYPKEG
ncbi:MAG: WbqC family protein [Bacteroidales bacterium]